MTSIHNFELHFVFSLYLKIMKLIFNSTEYKVEQSVNDVQCWVGFNDMETEACFRWLPSRDQPEYPVTFTAWHGGECQFFVT